MSGHAKVVEAATEAMSLPGEKGIVRSLTRDDAERAVDATLAAVVGALRAESFMPRDVWDIVANFIEREFASDPSRETGGPK